MAHVASMSSPPVPGAPRLIADVSQQVARIRFDRDPEALDRLRLMAAAGYPLAQCADVLGLPEASLKEYYKNAVAAFLTGQYSMSAEQRKTLQRATLNKAVIDGIVSDDPEDRKIAISAAKAMAKDPEVGLDGRVAAAKPIAIDALEGIIDVKDLSE